MTARCHYCGRPAVAQHHLTGRPTPKARYFDPLLTIPLCQRHHDREHELLRRSGLEFLPPGADALGHRLARVLDFLGRSAEHGRPVVLEGQALEGLHALLLETFEATGAERRNGAA